MSKRNTKLNLNHFDKELSRLTSIVDKLNYWRSIKEKHIDKPIEKIAADGLTIVKELKAEADIYKKLFGDKPQLNTSLLIPGHLFKEHFKSEVNNPDYSYWFLEYKAKTVYELEIRNINLNKILRSKHPNINLNKILKRLLDEERKAETFLDDNNIDFNNKYFFSEYFKEIELCRVIDGYYESQPFDYNYPNDIPNDITVKYYARHVILKEFIESKLENVTIGSDTSYLPDPPKKLILFNSPETIKKLYKELKGHFIPNEKELMKALEGEQLDEPLYFEHNQNKFVELFKRVKYNGLLTSNSKEIKEWICANFLRRKNGKKEKFNKTSVYTILITGIEVTKKERICTSDWLPYKTHTSKKL